MHGPVSKAKWTRALEREAGFKRFGFEVPRRVGPGISFQRCAASVAKTAVRAAVVTALRASGQELLTALGAETGFRAILMLAGLTLHRAFLASRLRKSEVCPIPTPKGYLLGGSQLKSFLRNIGPEYC